MIFFGVISVTAKFHSIYDTISINFLMTMEAGNYHSREKSQTFKTVYNYLCFKCSFLNFVLLHVQLQSLLTSYKYVLFSITDRHQKLKTDHLVAYCMCCLETKRNKC